MGTEVQFKSFFPRYYSGRDINEDSNGCNWPLFYPDQTSPNGHLSNSFQFVTAAAVDASLDYEKFALKRKMLEHEAVFKKQVHELHRLYRIQKDLMDEIKRKDLAPYHSFMASNTPQAYPFNGFSRPSKIRKEKIDLQVPIVYIDLEESGENEAKDGFDLNQPAQMDDTASSEFVHPRSSSFFESMARAHQGSSNNKGTNDPLGFKERLGVPSQPKHNLPNKIHEIPHQFIADRTRLLPTCGAESSRHWDSGVASRSSNHQIAASYDREKSSFWLFSNQSSVRRSGAEKTEQTETPKKSLKNAVIDINLPCDDLITEEAPSTQKSTLKCDFDLNSCVEEDDTDDVAVDGRKKMGVDEIDLETPAFADTEEGSVCLEDTAAAEAIVAMSSLTAVEAEDVLLLSPDNLNWFVNIALRDQKKKKMDYFESMTLKLTEMDEEEHLPKAFEVEDDEVGPTPTNTGRGAQRGQRRRGRQQKKDFQRDILPGLASLSRQEVAEDLQAFGGLMRATGHVWGSASRKGSTRGRRRIISRPAAVGPTETASTADVARLEDGSLVGWGKTRRVRQQRCPAGTVRSNGSSSVLACGSGCLS